MEELSKKMAHLGTAALRLLPAELSHELGLTLLERRVTEYLPGFRFDVDLSGLGCVIPGIGRLKHPVGLAAGFDKNARCPDAFAKLGFAFLELGTVTPRPQPGNPKPRMFRYKDQMAIINRMGFNSDGAEAVSRRLRSMDWSHDPCPIGLNIGKNKGTPEDRAVSEYLDGFRVFRELARYIVINISSPNTEGLRHLANEDFLGSLASDIGVDVARVFVKLDPDTPKKPFQKLIEALCLHGYGGAVLCNTHKVMWPEAGGQSGHPLSSLSQSRLEWGFEVHRGRLVQIASGGIFSGLDVFERIARGASAVQIYSALVYRGPYAVKVILEELKREMSLRGFDQLEQVFCSYYEKS